MRLLTAIALSFFVLCTTRALPLPIRELSFERDLPGRYSPARLTGREIHNADFNNAGGPPQTVNSGSQDPNHPSSGTQAKPGSPQQDDQSQPNSPPNVKAARSESEAKSPKFYTRKLHTIKSGDRRHSVKTRILTADHQGAVPKHGYAANNHHSTTISSRKATHQDPDSGATPPAPTTSKNTRPVMGIKAPSFPGRYEDSGASSNNDGDEKSIYRVGRLSKVNKAVADNGPPNSPLSGAILDPRQAV